VRILAVRALRAFGDGFVALLLPIYLSDLGFTSLAKLIVGIAYSFARFRAVICGVSALYPSDNWPKPEYDAKQGNEGT
jgi:hypothetical protein